MPIVVMGDVGLGKSTFIHHALKVAYAEHDHLYSFFLELRGTPTSDRDILGRIFNQRLERDLEKTFPDHFKFHGWDPDRKRAKLEEIFQTKLEQHLTSYGGSTPGVVRDEAAIRRIDRVLDNYLHSTTLYNIERIRYLRDRLGVVTVFVFDNFDHEIHNDQIQENLFGLAKSVMMDFASPSIFCMRNYTKYDSWDRYGYMEAHKYRTITLTPVRPAACLDLRRTFIIKRLPTSVPIPSGRVVLQQKERNDRVLEILSSYATVPEILDFLRGISGTNLRTFLALITKSLQSTHLQFAGDHPSLTYAAFIRTVMLGNNPSFSPNDRETMVINLFDNNGPVSATNLLVRIRVLQYLNSTGQAAPMLDIYKALSDLSHDKRAEVRGAIDSMVKAGLIDIYPHHQRDVDEDVNDVALTAAGTYYLTQLLADTHYIETVLPATNLRPVVALKLGSLLEEGVDRRAVDGRVDSLTAFAQEVSEQEAAETRDAHPSLKGALSAIYPRIAPVIRAAIKDRYGAIA